MSYESESKVVELRFDNKEFERNTATTLSSLDKLNAALKFDGAAEGFEKIEKASKKVDLSGLESNVERLSNHLTTLGGKIKAETIDRISKSIVDIPWNTLRNVMSLPSQGFEKYEQQVSAVQRILNNLDNETMDSVSAKMDKLSWYTDETSYHFDDMVNNISKFTSQGIDLDTSLTSMIGIANAAGLAGANAEDASHAMDGFSKAVSKGYMDRQNWMWIQTAKMETPKLKQALIDAAVAAGTLKQTGDGIYEDIKGNEVTVGNFLENMKDGWITADVMTSTFKTFGGYSERVYEIYSKLDPTIWNTTRIMEVLSDETADQTELFNALVEATGSESEATRLLTKDWSELSETGMTASQETKSFSDAVGALKEVISSGWRRTFDLVIGNYEEATEMWSNMTDALYEVVQPIGTARNEILEFWKAFNGRENIIQTISNLFHAIQQPFKLLGAFFDGLLPNTEQTGKGLAVISAALATLTGKLVLSDEKLKALKDRFREAGETVKRFLAPLKVAGDAILTFVFFVGMLGSAALSAVGGIAGLGASVKDAVVNFMPFRVVLAGAAAIIGTVVAGVTTLASKIKGLAASLRENEKFQRFVDQLGILAKMLQGKLQAGWQKLIEWLQNLGTHAETARAAISQFFTKISQNAKLNAFGDKIKEVAATLGDKFLGAFNKLFNTFTHWDVRVGRARQVLQEFFDTLKNHPLISTLGTKFTELGNKIQTFVIDKFQKAKVAIENFFKGIHIQLPTVDGLRSSLDKLQGLFDSSATSMNRFNTVSRDMAQGGGTNPVVAFLQKFWEGLKRVWETLKSMEPVKKFMEWVRELMSKADWHEKIDFLKDSLKKLFNVMTSGQAIILIFSAALLILIRRVSKLTTAVTDSVTSITGNFNGILKSVQGISDAISKSVTGVTNSITGAFNGIKSYFDTISKMKKAGGFLTVATGIAVLALSVTLLGAAFDRYGNDMWMGVGVIAVLGTVCLALTVALEKLGSVLGNGAKISGAAAGLIGLIGSLALMAGAIYILGKLDLQEIGRGLLGMAGGMLIFGAALWGLSKLNPVIDKSALYLLAFAGAFVIMAEAVAKIVTAMNGIPIDEFQERFIGLVGTLLAMGVLMAGAGKMKFTAGAGMLGAIASIYAMLGVLAIIGRMDLNTIDDRMWTVISIFTALGILMGVLGLMSKKLGADNVKAATTITSLALALLAITVVLNSLSKMDLTEETMGKLRKVSDVAASLIVVMGLMAGLSNAMSALSRGDFKMGGNAAKSIKALAGALLEIVIVVALMNVIVKNTDDVNDLWTVVGIIAALEGVMAVSAGLANLMTKGDASKAIRSLMGPLISLGVILALLSMFKDEYGNPVDLITPAKALMMGMLGLAAMIAACGKITEKVKTLPILAMTLDMIAIAAALSMMAYYGDAESNLAAGAAIAGTLLAMAGVFLAINNMKIDAKTFALVAEMAGVIFVLASTLGKMQEYVTDGEALIQSAEALGIALLAVGGAIALLGLTEQHWASALILLAMCPVLVSIAYTLSMLAEHDWDRINAALNNLAKALGILIVAFTILNLINNLGGGLASAAAVGILAGLAAVLWIFAAAAEKFAEAVNKFSDASNKVVLSYAEITAHSATAAAAVAKSMVEMNDAVKKASDEIPPIAHDLGYKIGSFLDEGFEIGLQNGIPDVADAAEDLADRASEAIDERLGIHSPAEDGINKGEMEAEGMVIGLESKQGDVAEAAQDVADAAGETIGSEENQKGFQEEGKTMGSRFAEGFKAVIDKVKEWFSKIVDKIGDVSIGGVTLADRFSSAWETAKTKVQEFKDKAVNWVKEVTGMNNLTSALDEYTHGAGLGTDAADAYADALKKATGAAKGNTKALDENEEMTEEEIAAMIYYSKVENYATDAIDANTRTLQKNHKELSDTEAHEISVKAIEDLVFAHYKHIGALDDEEDEIVEYAQLTEKQLAEAGAAWDEYYGSIHDKLASQADIFSNPFESLDGASLIDFSTMWTNLNANRIQQENIADFVEDLIDKGLDPRIMQELWDKMDYLTFLSFSNYSEDQIKQINLMYQGMQDAISEAATRVAKYGDDWTKPAADVGAAVAEAIGEGMKEYDISPQVSQVWSECADTFMAALNGEHTTDALTAMGLGEYVDRGLAKGITDFTDLAEYAVRQLAEDMIAELERQVQAAYSRFMSQRSSSSSGTFISSGANSEAAQEALAASRLRTDTLQKLQTEWLEGGKVGDRPTWDDADALIQSLNSLNDTATSLNDTYEMGMGTRNAEPEPSSTATKSSGGVTVNQTINTYAPYSQKTTDASQKSAASKFAKVIA